MTSRAEGEGIVVLRVLLAPDFNAIIGVYGCGTTLHEFMAEYVSYGSVYEVLAYHPHGLPPLDLFDIEMREREAHRKGRFNV